MSMENRKNTTSEREVLLDVKDLQKRPVYRLLTETGLFDKLVVMRRDKTWTAESLCGAWLYRKLPEENA